jgi:adenylosuccinate synthase
MPQLVIEGTQWGDEGKGKLTDYLAQSSDVVCRFQGGNNAGHTIIFNNNKFALSLVPSGIFSPLIKNVLANGCVINPKALLAELHALEERGIKEYHLYISDRAQVVLPYHIDLDGAYEGMLQENKIGTTKKGIGPCYEDKAARRGIRIGDLINPKYLKERLTSALAIKNKELDMFGLRPYSFEPLYQDLLKYGEILKPFICDTSILLNDEIKKGSRILFEGAQGAMLCLDHGSYPYVTSSSPLASSIPLNAGIAPKYIDNVLGIAKSYTTRVGEGPFPSEQNNVLGDLIREKGHEYGTVTHRPRRVGYLDTVVLNQTIRVSGVDNFALTLLDVLTGIHPLKICYAYNLDGKVINYIPSDVDTYKRCIPLFEELRGWDEDITNVKSYDALPFGAQEYILRIEKLTGIPVAIFSVGPDRLQTVIRKEVF